MDETAFSWLGHIFSTNSSTVDQQCFEMLETLVQVYNTKQITISIYFMQSRNQKIILKSFKNYWMRIVLQGKLFKGTNRQITEFKEREEDPYQWINDTSLMF